MIPTCYHCSNNFGYPWNCLQSLCATERNESCILGTFHFWPQIVPRAWSSILFVSWLLIYFVVISKHISKEQRFVAICVLNVLNYEIAKGGSPKTMWISGSILEKACNSLSKLPCKEEHAFGYTSGALGKSVSLHLQCNVTEGES